MCAVLAADGQPARLRVEMQMMDSYHLKCIVLELFDGTGGVHGRAVDARYVLTKDHGLGWKFVNADGSLNGTDHPLGTNPKGAGYGIADFTLVPRDIDVGGNCGGRGANYYLPRLRLARAGKAKEIHAWQNKWVEERLPIAPPASGWTCEKLVDEIVKAALTLENQGGR